MNFDYYTYILIRMAYHSCAIEGNSFQLFEVTTVFMERKIPNGHKSIREFYEIENHKATLAYVMDAIMNQEDLSLNLIKTIHAYLTDRLQHDRGQFKSSQNAIVGADFKTASPQETPLLMQQWVDNINYRIDLAKDSHDFLLILAESHIAFERIHPFSDGNGRTGRLLLLFLSLKYLNAPVIINKENRAAYMEALANQDAATIATMLQASLTFEQERMTHF